MYPLRTDDEMTSRLHASPHPVKHMATLHKVQRLLDTPIDEDTRDMLVYADTLAPHLFAAHSAASPRAKKSLPAPSLHHDPHEESSMPYSLAQQPPQPQPLRRALEMRIPALHRDFVRSLATLNAVYETAAARVQSLHHLCTELHDTLASNADEVGDFVAQVARLQAARTQARHRSAAVKDFARRFDFDTAQRQLLHDSKAVVGGPFIDAVIRARAVQRRCRALLLSPSTNPARRR